MRLMKFSNIIVLVAVFIFSACEHEQGGMEPEQQLQPTLSSIQANIFTPRCAFTGCHVSGPDFLPSSMPLSNTTQSFNSLVDQDSEERPQLERVDPGDAESSYLIHKLEGRSDIVGDRMPSGGPFLSTEQIDIIKQWIDNGAQNN